MFVEEMCNVEIPSFLKLLPVRLLLSGTRFAAKVSTRHVDGTTSISNDWSSPSPKYPIGQLVGFLLPLTFVKYHHQLSVSLQTLK